ncbi:MAG: DUF2080 family transposase-associated protein [Nanoarchaeota archaeon]
MIIIKKTREVGTSAGVLLPREWLNKQVIVQLIIPDTKIIKKRVIDILVEKDLLQEVIGIYQTGSIARNESDEYSDIDILIVTENYSGTINEENYSIILIPKKELEKSLEKNPIYYLPMIKEAKTIINPELIAKYKKYKLTKKGVLSYIKSSMVAIKRSNHLISLDEELGDKNTSDAVAYSLVLRIRGAYILESIINNKMWNKKELIKIINNKKIYQGYLARKEKKKNNRNYIPIDEAKVLIKLLENMLQKLEKWAKEK